MDLCVSIDSAVAEQPTLLNQNGVTNEHDARRTVAYLEIAGSTLEQRAQQRASSADAVD